MAINAGWPIHLRHEFVVDRQLPECFGWREAAAANANKVGSRRAIAARISVSASSFKPNSAATHASENGARSPRLVDSTSSSQTALAPATSPFEQRQHVRVAQPGREPDLEEESGRAQ